MLHGAEDEATDPGASEIFVREAGSTDKTFASLPNAGHLIAHERATRDVVTRAIVDFVVSRAAAAAATTTPGASEREEDARGSAGASRRGGGGRRRRTRERRAGGRRGLAAVTDVYVVYHYGIF